MGLNGCKIQSLIMLNKQGVIGIIELALPFEKISPKYLSVTSEELDKLEKVSGAIPIKVEPIIELPIERPIIRISFIEKEERVRRYQQK